MPGAKLLGLFWCDVARLGHALKPISLIGRLGEIGGHDEGAEERDGVGCLLANTGVAFPLETRDHRHAVGLTCIGERDA